MGFGGITVSDYSSVGQLATVHHLCKTKEEAGRLALEAGMDQELPAAEGYTAALRDAIAAGAVDPALLDEAVLRILTAKFRLGLFEHPFPADEQALAGEGYGIAQGRALSAPERYGIVRAAQKRRRAAAWPRPQKDRGHRLGTAEARGRCSAATPRWQ